MNNLIFIIDVLSSSNNDVKNLHNRSTFLEYISKTNSRMYSHSFYSNLNIFTTIPTDEYIVFYETLDCYESFTKLLNNFGKLCRDDYFIIAYLRIINNRSFRLR